MTETVVLALAEKARPHQDLFWNEDFSLELIAQPGLTSQAANFVACCNPDIIAKLCRIVARARGTNCETGQPDCTCLGCQLYELFRALDGEDG